MQSTHVICNVTLLFCLQSKGQVPRTVSFHDCEFDFADEEDEHDDVTQTDDDVTQTGDATQNNNSLNDSSVQPVTTVVNGQDATDTCANVSEAISSQDSSSSNLVNGVQPSECVN